MYPQLAENPRARDAIVTHFLGQTVESRTAHRDREVRVQGIAMPKRGAGHYYALSGPSLLIEYDNTQDGANHIHSVWRDLRRDFAGDLLAQHYAGVRH